MKVGREPQRPSAPAVCPEQEDNLEIWFVYVRFSCVLVDEYISILAPTKDGESLTSGPVC